MFEHYVITTSKIKPYRAYDRITCRELVLSLCLDQPAPDRLFLHKYDFYLTATDHTAKLHIHLYEGELHYYYSDYQNYYYLPEEDIAIHKSVAAYVDKAHRKQASVTTAYLRKTGIFLPQFTELYQPAYKRYHHESISYFEISDSFCENTDRISEYTAHVLGNLFS